MRVRLLGVRGSVASPGPETVRYGGNTSCVQVVLSDGTQIVLDAGTGIRHLGADEPAPDHVHILLTHLHLDHIQGLLFFSPLFHQQAEVTIWGPAAPGGSLQDRIARYLSAPLTPVEVRELPCRLDFRDCPPSEWQIGPARIRAEAVSHRGPTLGFRITDADATLCYIPDHEPAIAGPLEQLDPEWISGHRLAHGADLLLHDCQYTDEEYALRFGWGHSSLTHVLTFARRAGARRTMLFHHDPHHTDDDLDALSVLATARWAEQAADGCTVELARERLEIELAPRAAGATEA